MGADYTEVNSIIFYCGFFLDYNSTDENDSIVENRIKQELQSSEIELSGTNNKTQPKQIFEAFDEYNYKDVYDVAYKAFRDIVNKVKSISEQSCS